MTDTTSNADGGRGPISRAVDKSRLARTLRAPLSDDGPLSRGLDGSWVAGTLRAPFRAGSYTMRAWSRLSDTTRNSFLYRWLTKEPEPEVVVIDLRETWTVGPVIAVLDRFVDLTTPYWRGSTLKRRLDDLVALGERAADTRYGQLFVRLLEPPAPPERAGDSDDRTDAQSTERPDGKAD